MSLLRLTSRALRLLCLLVFTFLIATTQARAQSTTVVIDQVFGGGGGAGATTSYQYSQDYVELFNLSKTSQSIGGWSVQYMSAGGTSASATSQVIIPSGTTLAPGQRYLIAGPTGGSATAPYSGPALPVTPDQTAPYGSFAISSTAGKVFLTNSSTLLTNSCTDATIVDYIGFGTTASCYEGTGAAPAPTALSAEVRTNACTNLNDNSKDYALSTSATPRNSSSTKTPCVTATAPSISAASTSPGSIPQGGSTLLTAAVTAGSPGTISSVTADLSAFGLSATTALNDSGTGGDKTAGDGTYSYTLTLPNNQVTGSYSIKVTVTDSGSLTGTANAALTVTTAGALGASSGTATPNSVTSGFTTLLTATVTPSASPASTGIAVTADLSAFAGGSATQALYDDGTHGDKTSGDNTYSFTFTVPASTVPVGSASKNFTINFTATDAQSRSATTSAALTVVAPIPPTVSSFTLSTSATTAFVGSPVSFTAVVTGNMTAAPNGKVTFSDGATVLGTGTLAAGTSSATYTYTTSALALGSHTITAAFSGDTLYPNSSTTTPASVTVVISALPLPDFTFTLSNQSIAVNGASKYGTTVVSAGFINGFTGPVALSCTGLPDGSRCSFNPSTLTTSGNSVMTVAIDGATLHQRTSPFDQNHDRNKETAIALGFLALPFLLRSKLRRKLRNKLGMTAATLCVLCLGAALVGMTGCGSGTTTNTGTSTLTVTGTGGGVTHTATITLTVQ